MIHILATSSLYDWLPGIITAIFSGGVTGSIVALVKMRPEAGQIVVSAAQGALVVQTGVIQTLREENQELRERVELVTRENASLKAKVATLQATVDALNEQITDILKNQVRHDGEVKDLQGKVK